jgi:hypothetical protein
MVVSGHRKGTLIAFVIILRRQLFTLRSDLIFCTCVILAVLYLTPVHAPRDLYPIHMVWMLIVARALLGLRASKTKSLLARLRQGLVSAG